MAALTVAAALTAVATAGPARADESDALFFSETGFGVWNPEIRAYFESRGGVETFGLPISNVFTLYGFEVQLFQRKGVQIGPSGSPRGLDILQSPYLDYRRFGGQTIPQVDDNLVAAAPTVGSPGYAEAVRGFIQTHVPDSWQGRDVGFLRQFLAAAPPETPSQLRELVALEIWGFPRSRPMPDPANASFIYQRFQRGVMHYTATTGAMAGLPLGGHLKSLITGDQLSASLAAAAAANPLLRQYAPHLPLGTRRPAELPDTDLTDAFLPATDVALRSPEGAVRFGVIALRTHDSGSVRNVLARTGARSYLDYTASLADAPPGSEKMAVVRPSNEPSGAELRAQAARHPGAAWAIGNEPNTGLQDNLSPRAYAAFFDRVVTAIRAGDPSARIVAPNTLNFDFRCRGCAGDDPTGREWIDGFRSAYRELRGTEPPIDVWGIHAYEIDWVDPPMTDASVMQAQLEGLRVYLDSIPEHRGRPIWLTEFAIIWGYDDWRFSEGPDGALLVAPAGRFRNDLIEVFLGEALDWLETRGEQLGVERWFVFADHGIPDPIFTAFAGISLLEAPDARSDLTRLGRIFRRRALT
ncbi:MAG: glycosyl hydrolase [Chloroflexota bacterium]|nr:glycosyl hydrolase [Chloroflexota bacterium]MDE2920489.1 glycosyl hydrolase [Chloroflexota bacterium]